MDFSNNKTKIDGDFLRFKCSGYSAKIASIFFLICVILVYKEVNYF